MINTMRNQWLFNIIMKYDTHTHTRYGCGIHVLPWLQSFRYCPSNIEVISWLGAYYMESHFVDKAIGYFERASFIQLVYMTPPIFVPY